MQDSIFFVRIYTIFWDGTNTLCKCLKRANLSSKWPIMNNAASKVNPHAASYHHQVWHSQVCQVKVCSVPHFLVFGNQHDHQCVTHLKNIWKWVTRIVDYEHLCINRNHRKRALAISEWTLQQVIFKFVYWPHCLSKKKYFEKATQDIV